MKINQSRSTSLVLLFIQVFVISSLISCNNDTSEADRPNIILLMSDDQGWGDVGYHGHPQLQTPNLDKMAEEGIRLEHYYSAAPVCSPTRGSCLTGRHPFRYGIFTANAGHMPEEELTLAEVLKDHGYLTGHFGKWHLGTLTTMEKDANRGEAGDSSHYSPPWKNGFDVCFSTESKVPTWDPMITPDASAMGIGKRTTGEAFGTYYWEGEEKKVTENLDGDDSRVIMDRLIPFITKAKKKKKPFLAVVWFHTPHLPVLAGEKYRNIYSGLSEDQQHFYGSITAMDEQIGRLRTELEDLGISDNTMLWFSSDNGPEGKKIKNRTQGSAGIFSGRKRSLLEGGLRVPSLLVWPKKIKEAGIVDIPCSSSDYYPTILDMLDIEAEQQTLPLDGISLLPFIKKEKTTRESPIPFIHNKQRSLVDDNYKLYSRNEGETYSLYNLEKDPAEQNNIIEEHREKADSMIIYLNNWVKSTKQSLKGKDYIKSKPQKNNKPNIVFILADDLGKEWISSYGAEGMNTPEIDKLAESGMRLDNVYSMPQCTPTRVTFLTGQYPFRHGWINHWDVPRWGGGAHFDNEMNPSMGLIMQEAGYKTLAVGKWQINDFRVQPDAMEKHGFDDYCMWTGYETGNDPSAERYYEPYLHTKQGSSTREGDFGPDIFSGYIKTFLEENKDEPMFIYYPMVLTHKPYTSPPGYEKTKNNTTRYTSMVEYADKMTGKLVANLEEAGLRDNTIIIFSCDNGSPPGMTGNIYGRKVVGGKGKTSEAGSCMPFIINYPPAAYSGDSSDALVDYTDLLPSFAEIAGASLPEGYTYDGKSFADLILGKTNNSEREWILAMGGHNKAKLTDKGLENQYNYRDRVIRNKRYKLCMNTKGQADRFYDLKSDPGEENNLIKTTLTKEAAANLEQLMNIASQLPEKDNDPKYKPTPPQEWDRKITEKSQVWKQ